MTRAEGPGAGSDPGTEAGTRSRRSRWGVLGLWVALVALVGAAVLPALTAGAASAMAGAPERAGGLAGLAGLAGPDSVAAPGQEPGEPGAGGPDGGAEISPGSSTGTPGSPAQEIPDGCPGSDMPGPPAAGTVCPDGTTRPTLTDIPGCYGGPLEAPEPGTICPDGTAPRNLAVDDSLADWLHQHDSMEHPLTAYDIGCDEGDATAFMRRMWCGFQALPFAMGKWLVGVSSQLMEWALAFEVAELLTPMAGLLSQAYDVAFIGPLNLIQLAWMVTIFVFGISIIQGRTSSGIREVVSTALIFIFGTMVIANPEGYLEGTRDLAQNTSGVILQATDDAFAGDAGDDEEVRGRLSSLLQRAFVAEPYDLINWGEPLTGDCAAARNEILAQGPWGSSDTPRQIMRDAGCEAQADYNANPTDNRALASALNTVAIFLAMLFLLVLALAVFVAQITLVLLFSATSFIWVIALFPMGRGVLWIWVSRLIHAVLTTVAGVFLLSWMSIVGTTVLSNSTDMPIVQRSLIIVILAYVVYKALSGLGSALDGARQRMAHMFQRAQSGKGGGAVVAAPGVFATNPVAVGRATEQRALTGVRRTRDEVGKVPERARGVVHASQAADDRIRGGARRVGGAGKAVVMAPVFLPQRLADRQAAQGQNASTPRSQRVRNRLDSARQTRQVWRTNVAHPVRATRTAKNQSKGRSGDALDWM